jgi:excisionase family DNA binding protein
VRQFLGSSGISNSEGPSPDSAAAAKRNSLWVSKGHDHAKLPEASIEFHGSANTAPLYPPPSKVSGWRMNPRARMTVPEIARRLDIGRLAVYDMLEQGIIPAIRLRRRWIITRHAYDQWERSCGVRGETGLPPQPEVTVLN